MIHEYTLSAEITHWFSSSRSNKKNVVFFCDWIAEEMNNKYDKPRVFHSRVKPSPSWMSLSTCSALLTISSLRPATNTPRCRKKYQWIIKGKLNLVLYKINTFTKNQTQKKYLHELVSITKATLVSLWLDVNTFFALNFVSFSIWMHQRTCNSVKVTWLTSKLSWIWSFWFSTAKRSLISSL